METQKTPTPEKAIELMTVRELCQRWRCTRQHVANLLNDNKLPRFRVGARAVRIPLAAVRQYEMGLI